MTLESRVKNLEELESAASGFGSMYAPALQRMEEIESEYHGKGEVAMAYFDRLNSEFEDYFQHPENARLRVKNALGRVRNSNNILNTLRTMYLLSLSGYSLDAEQILDESLGRELFEEQKCRTRRLETLDDVVERFGSAGPSRSKTIHDVRELLSEFKDRRIISVGQAEEFDRSILYHRRSMKGKLCRYLGKVIEAVEHPESDHWTVPGRDDEVWISNLDARRMVQEAVTLAMDESYKGYHQQIEFDW